MALFVGLDVGTQGTKALVWDEASGAVVGRGAAAYPLVQERPGQAEQDPADWLAAVRAALAAALAGVDASCVRGLAVSGQQHGLVALDAQRAVIRPAKLWCDVESAAEAEELSAAFGGAPLVASFTATKLLWLKRHEPDNFARLAHVLLPHDYVNFWLTGIFSAEASDASGTGVFDVIARRWDTARMAVIDAKLESCFPPLLAPGEALGVLRADLAAELGLPPGVLVGPGGGDNAMSALGAGAVEEGAWVVSLGTSGTLFGPARAPVLDATGIVCPFCDATGQGLPLICTINCTGATEEVRAAFGLDHAAATALAAAEPPGAAGVSFLPYLGGERTPNWPHASGAVLGLRHGSLRLGLLYRAAMEGATLSLVAALRRLVALGLRADALLLVGGGSKNALWRRVAADAFQLPLRFPAEPETAALGAALQAGAVAAGAPVAEYVRRHAPPLEAEVVAPDPAAAEAYREALARHEAAGAALFGGGGE
jgi:xylulokinase